jgi:hypothetical protein
MFKKNILLFWFESMDMMWYTWQQIIKGKGSQSELAKERNSLSK